MKAVASMKNIAAALLGFAIVTGVRAEPACDLTIMRVESIVTAFQGGVPLPKLRKILSDPASNKHTSKDEQDWMQMFAETIYVGDPTVLKRDMVVKVQLAICNKMGYDRYISMDQRQSYRPGQQVERQAPTTTYRRPANTTCVTNSDGVGGGYTNCTTY